MLSRPLADLAALDVKPVATHAPMVDLPSHNAACYNAVAKRAPVRQLLLTDAPVVHSKLVSALVAAIDLAGTHAAVDGNVTKRTDVVECPVLVTVRAAVFVRLLPGVGASCCACCCFPAVTYARGVDRFARQLRHARLALQGAVCFYCYLSPDLLYDRLLVLLLDALPQTHYALMRSWGNTTHQRQRHARVAALRAILRKRALLLPGREFSARFSFRAVAARPVVAHLGCACSTTPSLCMSRLPRCCAKVGLRLCDTASGARLFRFACQTHPVKAALSLPMLLREVRLCMPPLADVALPRRPVQSLHSTLCALHLTLHTLHFTLPTFDSTLYTLLSTLYTLHSTLPTLDSTLNITLHTLDSTLYHFRLHTLHFALHT